MDDTIPPLTKNVTQAQLVAAEPSTDPELLRELGLSSDQQTRQLVAGNPNTPVDVLLRLGAEFPSQLLDNPVFPLLLLENLNLVAEIPLPTLRSILRLENVPVSILEKLADKSDYKVQLLALVNNVQTQKVVFNRLNQINDSYIVESARLHINLAGELTEGYEQKVKEVIQGAISCDRNVFAYDLVVPAQICFIPEFIVECWVREPIYEHYLCRRIAYSPATSASILKHLAKHTDGYTRNGVAQNPNTSAEALRKLASKQEAGEPRIFLARNLNTPSDVLESLSKDRDKKVRISVAENPNTPLTVLQYLGNDTERNVAEAATRAIGEQQGEYTAEAVRKNPKTPPHVLEKLAEKDPQTVCQHPNTPSELLLEFSKSVNSQVREWVAKNPNAPVNILEQLADDDSSTVRQEVARNPNTPLSLLFKLFARDASLSDTIAYQMSREQYHSPQVKSILNILNEESTSHLETILQRLVSEGGEATRLFLARRVDLPAHILAQLTEATEVKVRQAVAQNANTPISALEKLARDEDSTVRMHTASKINLSPETLEELAVEKSSSAVHEKAMVNPSLPKEAVERILCGEYATDYLKLNPDFLSRHPDSKARVINYYAKSESFWVRFIALLQPQISQELLQEKSLSIYWLERLAVAQNPQAAQKILNQLAKDGNQLVQAAAKATLQDLS
ncbi:hypothetical protein [Nostoc sp. DedQUE07]|uniref:hypothetical protein n=1 Tax=Nostoc sp. DedQUE07 TaxID=3075392 RepID=UPI00391BBFD0